MFELYNPNSAKFEDGMWWFWDEIWANRYGPFETEEEAVDACAEYCRRELGNE